MTHSLEAGKRVLGFGANGSESVAEPAALSDFSPYDFSQVPLDPLRRWLTYFQQNVVMAEGKRWPIDLKSIDPRAFQPLGISQPTVRSFLEVLRESGFCQPVDEFGFDQHRILAFAALVGMYVELASQFGANLSKSPQDRVRMVVSATKGLLVSYPQLVRLISDSPHRLPSEPVQPEKEIGVMEPPEVDDTIRDQQGARVYNFRKPKPAVEVREDTASASFNLLEGITDADLSTFLAEVQSMMGDKSLVRISDIPGWDAFGEKVGLSATVIRRLLGEILAGDLAIMNRLKEERTLANRYNPASVFDESRMLAFAALCRGMKEISFRGQTGDFTWETIVSTLKRKLGSSSITEVLAEDVDTARPVWHAKQLQDILAAISQASARNSRTNSSLAKRHLAHRSPSDATSGLVVARGVDGRFDGRRKIVLPPADPPTTTVPGLDEERIRKILKKLSWSSQELVDLGGLELSEGDAKRVMAESARHHGAGGFHDNPRAPITHARLRNALELLLRGLEKKQGRFL